MIDERTLTDPSRCPACGAALPSTATCPSCGVSLRSGTAAEVWRLSVQAAGLLDQCAALLERLRVESRPGAAQPGYFGVAPTGYDPVPTSAPPTAPPGPAQAPVRTPEWSRRRVQNLLLGLGVLLLAVAAVIFLVVSWGVLGVGGRAAVMAGCTAVAAAGATVASRRGLTATAEAVALLTVGLGLLDAYGARDAGLAGLDSADGWPYWAGALAVIALAAGAAAGVLPLRSLRLSAAVLAQLPGPLLAAYWAEDAAHPGAVVTTVLTVQAVISVALAVGWPFGPAVSDARVVVVSGAVVAWLAAAWSGAAAAYAEDGSLVLATTLLLVLAGAAVGAAVAIGGEPAASSALGPADALLGAAALATVAAVWAPATELATSSWVPFTLSAAAVALLGAMLLVPHRWRTTPVLVFLLAAVAPGAAAAEAAAVAVVGPLSWLGTAWTEAASASARELIGVDLSWPGEPSTPLLLLSVAVALAVAAAGPRLLDRGEGWTGDAGTWLLVAAVPVLAVAVLTAPPALDLPFRLGLGVHVAAAALLLGAGPPLVRAGRAELGRGAMAAGTVVLGVAVAWSFAAATTTLAVLPVAAVVLALAAATARPRLLDRGGSADGWVAPAFGGGAVLLLIGEAAAIARYGGAGWPAVWSLTLSLGAGAAVAGAVGFRGERRRVLAAVGTAVFAADSAALTIWAGGSVADAGLVVTVTGALVVLVSCQTLVARAAHESLTTLLGGVGAGIVAVGVVVAADADRLWLALLAAGVAAGFAALQRVVPDRLGWLSGGLLAASSWVRLALSDVDAPEPYTVPGGIALVVVGALRRRRDPAYRSWTAYAPGLVLALVPSLLRAVSDPGALRPLLLGLAALAVLGVGVARRLQAPLVLGGLVLAVDALVQLSPLLADLYAAVPRWTVIGTVGLLLLGLGATYERRVRDVRLLHERISAYG